MDAYRLRRREALALVAAPLTLSIPQPSRAQSVDKIIVAILPVESTTALYRAIKTGMFANAGLDVEMVHANNGAAAMASVVSGSANLSSTNLLSICTAHTRGIPISIVAPNNLYTPRNREALLEISVDAAYKTGADLNGKTIGVSALVDIDTLAVKSWIDKNGGDSTTLKFIEVPNAALPEAILQHRIDAANIEPPVLDAALAAGKTRTLGDPMGAIAPTYLISAFVARTDWAQQNRAALLRFNRVFDESATYVNAHHAETAPLVAELTKIDLSVVEKMNRTFAGTSLDTAYIQPVIDAAAKYGLIPHAFPGRELLLT